MSKLMTVADLTSASHPARRAARAYARKCWWAEVEDLEQTAFVATTRAMETFDPKVGVPLDAYLYRAAVLAIKPYLLAQSAPVSAPRSKRDELKGLVRVDSAYLETGATKNDGARSAVKVGRNPTLEDQAPPIDVTIARERVVAKVRERLRMLLTDAKNTELALPVLLGVETSNDVAHRHGVDVQKIYLATLRAKRRIANDPALWQLWKDL